MSNDLGQESSKGVQYKQLVLQVFLFSLQIIMDGIIAVLIILRNAETFFANLHYFELRKNLQNNDKDDEQPGARHHVQAHHRCR